MKRLDPFRVACGVLSLLFLALLVLSGWALAANYVPSDSEAFSSVLYLRQDIPGGANLRAMHHVATFGLVLSGFAYLAAMVLSGRHTRHKTSWWTAAGLYGVILAICFFGYLLPMDQKAYWGTVVRLGIVETIPFLGASIAQLVRGGETFNASTLPRFYTLHTMILPALGLFLLLSLVRRVDADAATPPPRRRPIAWVTLLLVALVGVYLAALLVGAPLEPRADPTDTEYVPRPEWYFLWLFQIGKYVEAVPWVQSMLVPLLGFALIAGLPFMTRQRPGTRATLVGGCTVIWLGLTGLALWDDRELPVKLDYEEAMRATAGPHYQDLCYDCHGESGHGDGPQSKVFDLDSRDFADAAFWTESTEAELERAIRDGKGDDMPGFSKQLNSEEIDFLLQYIRENFGPATADTPPQPQDN